MLLKYCKCRCVVTVPRSATGNIGRGATIRLFCIDTASAGWVISIQGVQLMEVVQLIWTCGVLAKWLMEVCSVEHEEDVVCS